MSLFNIDLHMASGDMFCANCSRTVKNCVQNFLREKNFLYNYVSVNFKADIVNIVELDSNLSLLEVSPIVEDLKNELKRIGYNCVSSNIIDSFDDEQKSSESISKHKTNPYYDYLKLSMALTTGVSLMLAEHLEYFPMDESPSGEAVNITVGFFSTVLAGWLGAHHFINSWKKRSAMDTLIALGVSTSLIYSFLLVTVPAMEVKKSSTFFNVPLMILGFLKLSHILRDRLQENIEAQMQQIETHKKTLPRTVDAYLLNEEQEECFINTLHQSTALSSFEDQLEKATHVNALKIGTIICVENGAIVPIDSVILENNAIVREDFYGERGETKKSRGEQIYAGTVNVSSYPIFLQTICEAKDNHLKKAYDNLKKESEPDYFIEIVSQYFLWIVMASASISTVFWAALGPKPTTHYFPQIFFSMLLSACPCGLGLISINESMIKALAFKEGILIQNTDILNIAEATDVCVDKTGTLTQGEYEVEGIIGKNEESLNLFDYLPYAASLQQQIDPENRSAVSEAILKRAKKEKIDFLGLSCTSFSDNPFNKGRGGKATINGMDIIIGNKQLVTHHKVVIDDQWFHLEAAYAQRDKQAIFLAVNQEVKGLLILNPVNELEQQLRPGVADVLANFIKKGVNVHMLTGDTPDRALIIKEQLISQNALCDAIIICGKLTPQGKKDYIKEKQAENRQVIMLGDGRNDDPAFQQANWSLAIDNLAPIAHKAGAVLNGSLINLEQLMSLAKTYRESYYTSIGIAFGVNGFSMLISAGVFYPLTKTLFDPMISGMMMISSSLTLVLAIAVFQQLGKFRQENIKEQFNSSHDTKHVKKETASCWASWCAFRKPDLRDERSTLNDRLLVSMV